MNEITTVDLASLRFDGERFKDHALDVECTQELIAYRSLLLECAKALWRRRNPNRTQLPRGFEDGFRIQFDRLVDGSALVPLQRVRVGAQGELELGDEFDEAATLIDQTIAAANADDLLPEALPQNVIPLFRNFGKSLRDDEVLFTKARQANVEAAYTAKARKKLSEWVGASYEDIVDVVGEVRMANVGPGTFSLQIASGEADTAVTGRFSPEQEAQVLEALLAHRTARLRVKGVAEFSTTDRLMRKFLRIDHVDLSPVLVPEWIEEEKPVWEKLAEIGRSAPPGTWESLPVDLSARVDEFLYGQERKKP